eukprot:5254189-Pyramimonas_sp.AAC.1
MVEVSNVRLSDRSHKPSEHRARPQDRSDVTSVCLRMLTHGVYGNDLTRDHTGTRQPTPRTYEPNIIDHLCLAPLNPVRGVGLGEQHAMESDMFGTVARPWRIKA